MCIRENRAGAQVRQWGGALQCWRARPALRVTFSLELPKRFCNTGRCFADANRAVATSAEAMPGSASTPGSAHDSLQRRQA